MQDRIVREPECEAITGLSRTTRWRKEKKDPPQFPKRFKISENASGWLLSRLNSWLKAVAEGRPYDANAEDVEPAGDPAVAETDHKPASRKVAAAVAPPAPQPAAAVT